MTNQSLQYKLVRLPYDTVKKAGQVAVWPIHFGKTVATNTVDTMFKVIGTNTEDEPLTGDIGESIYDMAKFQLDIASMIYYYTELRSEIKKSAKALATANKMTVELVDASIPSDLIVLKDACMNVKKCTEKIESPEPTNGVDSLKKYQESIAQLNALAKRFGLDEGDLKAFQTYFDILDEPKDMVAIKGDLIRYDKFIDPQFRLGFGGSEWNRKNVEDMIQSGEKSYVYHIDDDFATTSMDLDGALGFWNECLWAIVVCPKKKKVTVVFRGTAMNPSDWLTDFNAFMVPCEFPGYTTANAQGTKQTFGKVHKGFYKYLFGKTQKGANGSRKSKGEEIVGMLKAKFFDLPAYKDFSLEVTGHSLGGALSTLFSMRLAALNDFPGRMITNVSFASPFLADEGFRQCFVDLERKRAIRHLRISNYQDIVPLVPTIQLNLLKPEGFKHVGMNIRLYEAGDLLAPKYRRFYPKMGSFFDGIRNTLHTSLILGLSVGIIGKHLCPEYDKRLEAAKDDLSKLTLDELYANEDVTGWKYL